MSQQPSTNELKAMNRRLADLSGVIYILNGYQEAGGARASAIYRMMSENLDLIWKQYARNLTPPGNIEDDIAREVGYAALSAFWTGNRPEQAAFKRAVEMICEVMIGWHSQEETRRHRTGG